MKNNFWGRVLEILERKDISRKEFANQIGISYSSIHNGVSLGSIPSADIALKIANALNTTIEYLVYGDEYKFNEELSVKNREAFLYRKNKDFIDSIDSLPNDIKDSLKDLIEKIKKE